MLVKFDDPFYSTKTGLIPRKRDLLGRTVELRDSLVEVLPTSGVEIVEADDAVIARYDERVRDKKQAMAKLRAQAKDKEAERQTGNLIHLLQALQQGISPAAPVNLVAAAEPVDAAEIEKAEAEQAKADEAAAAEEEGEEDDDDDEADMSGIVVKKAVEDDGPKDEAPKRRRRRRAAA